MELEAHAFKYMP